MDLQPSERDTMRPMTEAELASWYDARRWPCCWATDYVRGPRGGISINLACPRCDMRLNVIDPESAWAASGAHFGQVIREARS